MIKEPMLAAKEATIEKLIDRMRFPMLASPKLDGIRAIVEERHAGEFVLLSRKLKPIPNRWCQVLFGSGELWGLDGELIVGDERADDVFGQTSSGVMSIEGKPNVTFHLFDDFGTNNTFKERLAYVEYRAKGLARVAAVPHELVHDGDDVRAFHEQCLLRNYEGSMYRDPQGPYKQGRSTSREGWLFKLKDFEDAEATVTGVYELQHNLNEATINELGRTRRSSHAENRHGGNTLGGFVLERPDGVVFRCGMGPGLTSARRAELWAIRDSLIGLTVKYSFLNVSVVDKPRHPKFLGFRDD